jgi:hypothetical protein
MRATQTRPASVQRSTPVWLWAALLAGAAVTAWWAWFVFGFIHEPSAVGPVLAVLLISIATSVTATLAGAVGAIALLRGEATSRSLAWLAAIAMTFTGVGAIAGVPALIGLLWSRQPSR